MASGSENRQYQIGFLENCDILRDFCILSIVKMCFIDIATRHAVPIGNEVTFLLYRSTLKFNTRKVLLITKVHRSPRSCAYLTQSNYLHMLIIKLHCECVIKVIRK